LQALLASEVDDDLSSYPLFALPLARGAVAVVALALVAGVVAAVVPSVELRVASLRPDAHASPQVPSPPGTVGAVAGGADPVPTGTGLGLVGEEQ